MLIGYQLQCDGCKKIYDVSFDYFDSVKFRRDPLICKCCKHEISLKRNDNYNPTDIPLQYGKKMVGMLRITDPEYIESVKTELKKQSNANYPDLLEEVELYELRMNQNLDFFFGYQCYYRKRKI